MLQMDSGHLNEVINELIRNYDKPWLYGYSFETYLFGLVLDLKISIKVPVEIKYNKNQNIQKLNQFDYPSIVLPFIYARLNYFKIFLNKIRIANFVNIK